MVFRTILTSLIILVFNHALKLIGFQQLNEKKDYHTSFEKLKREFLFVIQQFIDPYEMKLFFYFYSLSINWNSTPLNILDQYYLPQ